MKAKVFECRMCGQCCEGQGGIVVSPTDLERICQHLKLSVAQFRDKFGCDHNGKLKVRTGDDGNCIFFKQQIGCGVHVARPDICRAWPFFRGNMLDAESFFLAKDYCPGIAPQSVHADFVAEGLEYLDENNLQASNAKNEAHALIPMAKNI